MATHDNDAVTGGTTSSVGAATQGEGSLDYTFLICSERSGSNLIASVMNAHSMVSSPSPYHLNRDIGLNLHAGLDANLRTDVWSRTIKTIAGRISRMNSQTAASQFRDWYMEQRNIAYRELLAFVYEQLDYKAGARMIFVKENNIHKMLFFLLHYFPNAKFVFQVRDPRDYLLSALTRKTGLFGNKFGSNLNALEVWREDQLGGLRALFHLGPERVFYQRYEDLVSQPKQVLTKLCEFLGIPFEESMLEFHGTDRAQRLANTGGPRENLNKPLMSQNFNKYRTQLPARKIRMVEAYLGDLMARFGYQSDFPGSKSKRYSLLAPQLSEVLERYVNGESGPFYKSGIEVDAMGEPISLPYQASQPQVKV